ncbi:MAG: hypothetical protein ACLRIS_17120 [Flavonifractor plautii]
MNPPGIKVLPEAKRLVGSAGGRFLQHPLEVLPGVGGGTLRHLLGGAGDDDIAAAVANPARPAAWGLPPSPIPTRQAARGPRIDFICSGGVNPPGIKVLPEAKRLVGSAGGRFYSIRLRYCPV